MVTNADITIYNRHTVSGKDAYQRTTIYGVHWYAKEVRGVVSTGLVRADEFIVRLPDDISVEASKLFVSPKVWAGLSTVQKSVCYTLQDGDKIVRGATTFEITGTTGHMWADLEKTFDEVMTILGYSKNTENVVTPHIKIVGK